MKYVLYALLFVSCAGCRAEGGEREGGRRTDDPYDGHHRGGTENAAPSLPPAALTLLRSRAEELVAANCLSCHSSEILRQQRLTGGQWEKVVRKMAGWGADLTAEETTVVAAYLAAEYGPDAGTFEPEPVAAARAANESTKEDDGPFAAGNVERGRALYATQCASCHGADARGQLGVNLVDRPLLFRAADFARIVRRGRAKMPPQADLRDADVGDLLALLRAGGPLR